MTYYEQSGSVESIPRVRIPLLCIQASAPAVAGRGGVVWTCT